MTLRSTNKNYTLPIEMQKSLNSNLVCYEKQFSEQQLKSAKSTWKIISSFKEMISTILEQVSNS